MPQTQYALHLKGFVGGAVFTANNIPPQRNIIVFDDFVTTGQTLVSMQNSLIKHEKNAIFFAGINNKL